MRYGSVCSGIEAATMAWHGLNWEPAFFSDIEPFPCAALSHHYPEVPLHGDFTTIGADQYGAIDLLVGGTPCQSFSVAGLRKGMDDDRGNLALEFLRLAERKRPAWLVWENVPGVLSSNGGRDFGSFLGGLVELGYGFAYRVLNAQYFGVPQRRRRVFVVGYLGDWRPPAAVLFERHSLQGHPAPSREAGQGAAEDIAPCLSESSGNARPGDNLQSVGYLRPYLMAHGQANAEITENHSPALTCNHEAPIAFCADVSPGVTASGPPFSRPGNERIEAEALVVSQYGEVAGTLTARHEASPCADCGQNIVAMPINTQIATRGEKMGEGTGFGIGDDHDPAFTLQAAHSHGVAVAFTRCDNGRDCQTELSPTMRCGSNYSAQPAIAKNMQVRRLTPVECQRLQGFPDDFTKIPYRGKPAENCPDGPRYKALGNSMAVPVMRWIGERIEMVSAELAK